MSCDAESWSRTPGCRTRSNLSETISDLPVRPLDWVLSVIAYNIYPQMEKIPAFFRVKAGGGSSGDSSSLFEERQ
jgi:hypothetical protein